MTLKQCPGCDESKPLDEFYPDASKRLGVGTYCKPCSAARAARAYERRKATPKTTPLRKTCQTDLPADAFWRSPSARDGLMPECKDCRKDRVRGYRYGLPTGEYDRLVDAQFGACAACLADDVELVVDHDHVTGAVRGLLCSNCNTAVGLTADDPDRLLALAAYLSRTTTEARTA